MTRIRLTDVTKQYGDFLAVDDVTLETRDGEFIVLLGPSGCGKTSTLRMIAGLESITSGEIALDDEVVNDQSPAERDLAMVFQEIALYPHMTVYDNIASPLRADKVAADRIEERVHEIAAMLDIDDLLGRRPGELSGGQQQRVAIGRALVREPAGFLLDEPFSSLDQKLRVEMQKELKRLQRQTGVTTFFVTHDQEEALVLADRIVVMNDGEVQQIADPDTLYRRPANVFVAEFIGNPKMNFFRITHDDGGIRIDGHLYETATADGALDAATRLAARPEDIRPRPDVTNEHLQAEVELVEMRGGQTYLICTKEGKELTVELPNGADVTAGDRIGLEFDFDSVNFFDEEGLLIA